ncbi:MAG: hypothetical protein R2708_00750 [Vicinamibacterales bacterium]
MHDGEVLAAVDRPEEGVADRLPLIRGPAVGGQQEAGRAAVVLNRVVEKGQVEDRHVLHVHDGVPQDGVIADVDRERAGHDLPARRRLHAGREAALGDAVAVLAGLLDHLAVEVDVGLERAEHALVGAVADRRHARGAEERAGARAGVEDDLLGGDARERGLVEDVPGGLELVGLGVDLHQARVELLALVSGVLDLDLAGEPPVRGVDLLDAELLAVVAGHLRQGCRGQGAQREHEAAAQAGRHAAGVRNERLEEYHAGSNPPDTSRARTGPTR